MFVNHMFSNVILGNHSIHKLCMDNSLKIIFIPPTKKIHINIGVCHLEHKLSKYGTLWI